MPGLESKTLMLSEWTVGLGAVLPAAGSGFHLLRNLILGSSAGLVFTFCDCLHLLYTERENYSHHPRTPSNSGALKAQLWRRVE